MVYLTIYIDGILHHLLLLNPYLFFRTLSPSLIFYNKIKKIIRAQQGRTFSTFKIKLPYGILIQFTHNNLIN